MEVSTVSTTDNQTIKQHIDRLDEQSQRLLIPLFAEPSADPWIRDVLFAYFRYYLNVLRKDVSLADVEVWLEAELRPLALASIENEPALDADVPEILNADMDRIENILSDGFKRRGYHFLGGRTSPYYGPYVWKRTERHIFDVDLPDGSHQLPVHFMHDFLTASWYRFHTYGKVGTGGWAKWDDADFEDGIYCFWDSYKLSDGFDDPVFQNSFLKHEAQHIVDFQQFPEMESIDLEYRAKLVEVMYFTSPEYRFHKILREAEDTPEFPHKKASHRIVQDMSSLLFGESFVQEEARWQNIDYSQIQEMARRLFDESTQKCTLATDSV